ncbi:MAG: hypothetical protein IJ105_03975 [Bacilli bacterium]|nr:hypothetical protein [Bacilli bacterium]
MNKDIIEDLFNEKYNEYINNYIDEIIKENLDLIKDNEILQIEYNYDGSKKDIYSLASERDIKKVQINSDKNELDYKFSQNKMDKEEYEININDINKRIKDLDLLYDDLIFEIINNKTIDEIKESIIKYKLNNIDLDRLARAISSVSENKIEEFRNNNKSFMLDKLSYWNYKYDKISKAISKSREVENFILSLIEK